MTGRSLFSYKKLKLIGSKRSALDVARGRLVFAKLVFSLLFIMVAVRVVDLSFIQGTLHAQNYEQAIPVISDKPVQRRADIVDRNGVLLATSLETASLYADPMLILDHEKVAVSLVEILPHLTYGAVLQKLQRKGRFIWLSRNLTPQEQYAVLELGEPGLGFQDEMKRIYPQGTLAPHIVGYTNVDGYGLAGVERSFDQLLREGDVNGDVLRLSLDMRLQHVLRREAHNAMTEFSAKAAAGVIMDITNGEVLAAVSLPDFDPHGAGKADDTQLFNRLTMGVYELGSTFKIFSTAALIEHKKGAMTMRFDARKPLKVGRFQIRDYHPEKRILSLPEVFMHSSNIGSALMGKELGAEILKSFYADLGLLSKPQLEIRELGRPLYPQPWREINTLTASYGHGIAVPPIKMVAAAATVIGDGTLVKPTLILNNARHNETIKESKSRPDLRIVSPQTAHRMRQLMRLTVTEGTGKSAEVAGYRVGGKTGTADKPSKGGYDRSKRISSFMGAFPMDAPKYAVFIMVDEPKGTKKSFGYATGGWVAAPAVRKVIANMVTILGIQPVVVAPEKEISAPLQRYIQSEDKKGKHLVSY